uniref:Uncharacterized protein n=1 Tax=Fagus sylvatica TaxID=28930 RepID=A0A2N9FC17_FAGSY
MLSRSSVKDETWTVVIFLKEWKVIVFDLGKSWPDVRCRFKTSCYLLENEYVKFRIGLDEAQIKIVANEKTMEDFHAERDFEETGERKRAALAFGSTQDWSTVKIFDDEATTTVEEDSENEDKEDDVQFKEHAVTPSDVQSTFPSGDQSGNPAVSLMDGQVILPPIDKETS